MKPITGAKQHESSKGDSVGILRAATELHTPPPADTEGAIWEVDLRDWDGTGPLPDEIYLAPALKSIIGFADDEFPNSAAAWHARIHPDDFPCLVDSAKKHLAGERDQHAAEYRITHRDGSWKWIKSWGRIVRDKSGRPLHWVGVDLDVTDQRNREQRLQRTIRALEVLRFGAQELLALESETDYLRLVARKLTEEGGFGCVWVGQRSEESGGRLTELLRACATSEGPPRVGAPPRVLVELSERAFGLHDVVADSGLESCPLCGGSCSNTNRTPTVSAVAIPFESGQFAQTVLCICTQDATGVDEEELARFRRLREDLQVTTRMLRDRLRVQRVEDALQASQDWLKIAAKSAQMGLWKIDLKTNELEVTDAWKMLLGYAPEERNDTFDDWRKIVHPEDQYVAIDLIGEYIRDPWPLYEAEFRVKHRDGEWRWILSRATITYDAAGTAVRVTGTCIDITERKKGEEELRSSHRDLRHLAQHLESIREEEQRLLARELHDELGQALTTIKMDISAIERRCASSPELQRLTFITEKISSISGLVDSTIRNVRRLSARMRPSVLDNLGLGAAIMWLAEEMESHSHIEVDATEVQEMKVPADVATAMYRICQETMTNVARHSKATKVAISLCVQGTNLRMVVVDNGRGISDEEKVRVGSCGLIGMRERAIMLGGTVSIVGSVGKGTTVSVLVPMTMNAGGG